jgi:GNAT superfamily N-acetyltransferase
MGGCRKIVVRPFEEKHAASLAAMMLEMAQFYGATVSPRADIALDLVDHARRMDFLLAFSAETLVGFATFASLFPVGGLLSFTYIQQIYVAFAARRLGVARRLMAGIAQTARARGYRRLEWATSTDNTAARALYEGLGAVGSTKLQYVLEGGALDALALS